MLNFYQDDTLTPSYDMPEIRIQSTCLTSDDVAFLSTSKIS